MHGFKQEARRLTGVELSDAQVQAFEHYYDLVVEGNQRFNLTALTEREEVFRKHFLDSLSCAQAFEDTFPERVVDVGAGAGFPGLPLKILKPEMNLTLIEANVKKARFLGSVVEELGLEGVEILSLRAESVGQDDEHRERYDLAVARAVAPLAVLVEYLLPLVRIGANALAQKGSRAREEAYAAEKAVQLLGGRVKEVKPVTVMGMEEERHLITIEKIAPTPAKYPRKEGIPKKRPLG